MRYRSRTEIVTRILEVVNEGSSSSFGNGGVLKTTISVQCGWIMYISSSICLWLSFAPAVGIDMGLGLLRVSMLL
ncbi:MAG TPA: hypothetical protein VKA87_08700 [Nitrososphaeraceae archaeon]|nr:hypothetical protein [Nitrososphaeraceae archaeon]